MCTLDVRNKHLSISLREIIAIDQNECFFHQLVEPFEAILVVFLGILVLWLAQFYLSQFP